MWSDVDKSAVRCWKCSPGGSRFFTRDKALRRSTRDAGRQYPSARTTGRTSCCPLQLPHHGDSPNPTHRKYCIEMEPARPATRCPLMARIHCQRTSHTTQSAGGDVPRNLDKQTISPRSHFLPFDRTHTRLTCPHSHQRRSPYPSPPTKHRTAESQKRDPPPSIRQE